MRFRDVSPCLQSIKRKLEIAGNRETMRATTGSINPLLEYAFEIDECIKAIDRNIQRTKDNGVQRDKGQLRDH